MLVGSYEVAKRLGMRHPQLVHYFRTSDPSFPKPVAILGNPKNPFFVWAMPEVERWARKTGRLPAEPKAAKKASEGKA